VNKVGTALQVTKWVAILVFLAIAQIKFTQRQRLESQPSKSKCLKSEPLALGDFYNLLLEIAHFRHTSNYNSFRSCFSF